LGKSTNELPALFRNLLYAGNGLHEYIVGDTGFWHPNCTKEMDPVSMDGLLESPAFVGAQDAFLKERMRGRTTP